MPTWGVAILLNAHVVLSSSFGTPQKWLLIWYIVVTTFFLPALAVLLMKQAGIISSIEIPERSERKYPYLAAAFIYFSTYYVMKEQGLPLVLSRFMLATTTSILLAAIINNFYKISVHGMGLGGVAAMVWVAAPYLAFDARLALAGIVLIAGITGTARLVLKVHTPMQVYSGFTLGFLIISILKFI